MKIAFIGLVLLSLVAGCATSKFESTGKNIKEPSGIIKTGTTTRDEVISAFGEPSKVSPTDGGEELIYEFQAAKTPTYAGGLVVDEARQAVTVKRLEVVIKNNIVQSYKFETSEK